MLKNNGVEVRKLHTLMSLFPLQLLGGVWYGIPMACSVVRLSVTLNENKGDPVLCFMIKRAFISSGTLWRGILNKMATA